MAHQLQPVWELGGTLFNTASQLRDLMGILSRSNVQSQAIIAAEQLGFGLLASPKRIDEAIVALGGNESTRLESLHVLIGFTAGELQRIMRKSTSLVQFFLCMTACKLCYEDSELGDLAFEMMV